MGHSVILYAEDEQYDVLFLKQAFAQAGISETVQVVQNGRQAIDYLVGQGPYGDREQYPVPALTLLDLHLPYQSGFEVLKWIRQQPMFKNLIVLVYTSSDQPQDVERAYECHANGYLVKPSDPDQLCAMAKAVKEYWLVHNHPPVSLGREEIAGI